MGEEALTSSFQSAAISPELPAQCEKGVCHKHFRGFQRGWLGRKRRRRYKGTSKPKSESITVPAGCAGPPRGEWRDLRALHARRLSSSLKFKAFCFFTCFLQFWGTSEELMCNYISHTGVFSGENSVTVGRERSGSLTERRGGVCEIKILFRAAMHGVTCAFTEIQPHSVTSAVASEGQGGRWLHWHWSSSVWQGAPHKFAGARALLEPTFT